MDALVDYCSSNSSDDEAAITASVAKSSAPQPTVFDQPVRCFEHVDGVWASSVMFEVSYLEDLHEAIQSFQASLIAVITCHIKHGQALSDLHVSFTRTHALQHCYLTAFEQQLKLLAKQIKPFRLRFGNIVIFHNEDQTRSFAAITLHPGAYTPTCNALLEGLNNISEAYGQQAFYKDCQLHVSLCAWSHPAASACDLAKQLLPKLKQSWQDCALRGEVLLIDRLSFKAGQATRTVCVSLAGE
eukprot:m.31366 g.31366  ORF g.31366 m.31366 type:complete len:243 (+) comp12064_c0_seq1:111-839(+)